MFTHIDHGFKKLERITRPDGSRSYATPSGKNYPSVTTVTSLLSIADIMAWRERVGAEEANKISRRASSRGTRIHALCEDHLLNKITEASMFDQEMWRSMIPHLNKINNIHALESPLYSDHLEVGGTVDCVAEYEGRMSVIDFKTSAKVKDASMISGYFLQCSAYAVAFEERTGIPVSKLTIIMGVDDEKPIIFQEKRNTWIDKFIQLRKDFRNSKGI
jgi:hypothetical protein